MGEIRQILGWWLTRRRVRDGMPHCVEIGEHCYCGWRSVRFWISIARYWDSGFDIEGRSSRATVDMFLPVFRQFPLALLPFNEVVLQKAADVTSWPPRTEWLVENVITIYHSLHQSGSRDISGLQRHSLHAQLSTEKQLQQQKPVTAITNTPPRQILNLAPCATPGYF